MAVVVTIRQFDDYSVSVLKQAINDAQKNNQKVLPVAVNSPGGSVYKLFEMVDLLKASGLKIVTTLNGIAMSAGAILFSQGDERYMSENSTIMIHDASYMGWGKNSEMKSLSNHVDNMNTKLYKFLSQKSGKPENYFVDLVTANGNADLYLTSEEALKHGIITAIKVPDVNELMSLKDYTPVNSVYERTKIFMQMSDDYESGFTAKSGIETIDNTSNAVSAAAPTSEVKKPIINNTSKEVKALDLEELLALLTAEQKIPVMALQNKLTTVENSVNSLNQKLTDKETELTTVKATYEEKLTNMVAEQDKEFIENLFQNHQLSKADKDKELKNLSDLTAVPTAKAAYKEKLAKAPQVVEGEIPDNGERNHSTEASSGKLIDKMRAYAKQNNLDLTKPNDYEKARASVRSSEGVK